MDMETMSSVEVLEAFSEHEGLSGEIGETDTYIRSYTVLARAHVNV